MSNEEMNVKEEVSMNKLVNEITTNSTKAFSKIVDQTVTEFAEKNNALVGKDAQGFLYGDYGYTSTDLLNDTSKFPEFIPLHESLEADAQKVCELHDDEEQDLVAFQRVLKEVSIKCNGEALAFLCTIPESLIKFASDSLVHKANYSSSVREENKIEVDSELTDKLIEFANKYSTYSLLAS